MGLYWANCTKHMIRLKVNKHLNKIHSLVTIIVFTFFLVRYNIRVEENPVLLPLKPLNYVLCRSAHREALIGFVY